jgi:pSer/pThr/pTyr-binding forkhead associated (FHA) protein
MAEAPPPPGGEAPEPTGAPEQTPAPMHGTPARPMPGVRPKDPSASAQPAPPAPRSTKAADTPAPAPDALIGHVEAETRRNCPRCGALNPVTFRFCGSCGLNLEGDGTGAGYEVVPNDEAIVDGQRPTDPEGPAMAKLVLMLPDGSAGGEFTLFGADLELGRGVAPIFDADPYLSPEHVRFHHDGDHLFIEDAGSLNGTYVRISQHDLVDGDVFRMGQELLRFNLIGGPRADEQGTEVTGSPNPGFWGRLSLIVGRNRDGSAFPLYGEETVLGRERGDILFYDDGYVSGVHARIVRAPTGEVELLDLDSSNGTYIRIKERTRIDYGSMLVLGQQLFRVQAPERATG